MHRTSAALRYAAAKLGADQAYLFANNPQKRCGWVDIQLMYFAVDVQCNHVVKVPEYVA